MSYLIMIGGLRLSSRCISGGCRRRVAKTTIVALLSFAAVGCTKSVDFTMIDRADHIDVRTPADKQVSEIKDRIQIGIAIAFIKSHRNGWSESPLGPVVPDLMLHFYHDNERLGGFGIGRDHIVADPITSGWLSRSITPSERDQLLKALDLTSAVSFSK